MCFVKQERTLNLLLHSFLILLSTPRQNKSAVQTLTDALSTEKTEAAELKQSLNDANDVIEQLKAAAEKYKDQYQQLEPMKKVIAELTDFIANQGDDPDGSKAVAIVTQMKRMLDGKDPENQECGLNGIYHVVREKNREKIENIEGLVPKVGDLTKSEHEYVCAAAIRTLAKIRQEKCEFKI